MCGRNPIEHIEEIVNRLPDRHRWALSWFRENKGKEIKWPLPLEAPEGRVFLATRAKGIYKPVWSPYALSVRQTLTSQYKDREPLKRDDGSWVYSYFQENPNPLERDTEFTNRAMMMCWQDRVPVGVLKQAKSGSVVFYMVLGLALVSGWDGGYFFLEGVSGEGLVRPRGPKGELEALIGCEERQALEFDHFLPNDAVDARQIVMAQIVRRRGQPAFRQKLLDTYGGRCAISNCDAPDALEAAHILPYRGENTNRIENGILLRCDLHTLFDLGLICINPETLRVEISKALACTTYAEFDGTFLRLPRDIRMQPNIEALKERYRWCDLAQS